MRNEQYYFLKIMQEKSMELKRTGGQPGILKAMCKTGMMFTFKRFSS